MGGRWEWSVRGWSCTVDSRMSENTILTIGNFDGVHIGHAALIRRARSLAGPGGRVVAMAFEPHPLTVLAPGRAPAALMGFGCRSELLKEVGADEVVRLTPTPELLEQPPEGFIERLVARYRPRAIVEGADFRFGRARAGDVRLLGALGDRLGFEASIVEPVDATLSDQTTPPASSTLIRWLVSHGRVADARAALGRPHELTGVVVRGDRRGREIGFPTANIEPAELLPADGVYAGWGRLSDGRRMPAAIHVGPRAAFGDLRRTVEASLLDWSGPVAEGNPEYGWPLRLALTSWLRDQGRFDSIAELVRQIERDVARARAALSREAARTFRVSLPQEAMA